MIAAVPSAVGRHRLGVNVPKRIGHSVARHHLRRRLREAFRLTRKDLPGAYDIVIVVRALPLPGADLGAMLAEALAKLDLIWRAESRV